MGKKMDSLGDRMKSNYENRCRYYLTRRTPVIMRLDGKAFSQLTKNMEKPFSNVFADVMAKTAMDLCGEIQGAKCAYVQSDEISILLTDFDRLNTDAWFDYNIHKLVSVSASMASVYFNRESSRLSNYFNKDFIGSDHFAFFDSRAFNIPKEEVTNYFVWRQKDWIRNSVSMLAQANFSHKQLQGKSQKDMKLMLMEKDISWEALSDLWKYGRWVYKPSWGNQSCWKNGFCADPAPIFTEDREEIEKLLISLDE